MMGTLIVCQVIPGWNVTACLSYSRSRFLAPRCRQAVAYAS